MYLFPLEDVACMEDVEVLAGVDVLEDELVPLEEELVLLEGEEICVPGRGVLVTVVFLVGRNDAISVHLYSLLSERSNRSPASSTVDSRAAIILASHAGTGAPRAPAFSMILPASVRMYHITTRGQRSTE